MSQSKIQTKHGRLTRAAALMVAAGMVAAASGSAQAGGHALRRGHGSSPVRVPAHVPPPAGVYAVENDFVVILFGWGQRYTTDTRHWEHYFTPLDRQSPRPSGFHYTGGQRRR